MFLRWVPNKGGVG